jgi:hypothetical protein
LMGPPIDHGAFLVPHARPEPFDRPVGARLGVLAIFEPIALKN